MLRQCFQWENIPVEVAEAHYVPAWFVVYCNEIYINRAVAPVIAACPMWASANYLLKYCSRDLSNLRVTKELQRLFFHFPIRINHRWNKISQVKPWGILSAAETSGMGQNGKFWWWMLKGDNKWFQITTTLCEQWRHYTLYDPNFGAFRGLEGAFWCTLMLASVKTVI